MIFTVLSRTRNRKKDTLFLYTFNLISSSLFLKLFVGAECYWLCQWLGCFQYHSWLFTAASGSDTTHTVTDQVSFMLRHRQTAFWIKCLDFAMKSWSIQIFHSTDGVPGEKNTHTLCVRPLCCKYKIHSNLSNGFKSVSCNFILFIFHKVSIFWIVVSSPFFYPSTPHSHCLPVL